MGTYILCARLARRLLKWGARAAVPSPTDFEMPDFPNNAPVVTLDGSAAVVVPSETGTPSLVVTDPVPADPLAPSPDPLALAAVQKADEPATGFLRRIETAASGVVRRAEADVASAAHGLFGAKAADAAVAAVPAKVEGDVIALLKAPEAAASAVYQELLGSSAFAKATGVLATLRFIDTVAGREAAQDAAASIFKLLPEGATEAEKGLAVGLSHAYLAMTAAIKP